MELSDNLQPTAGPNLMLCGELDPVNLGDCFASAKFPATCDDLE